MCSMGMTGLTRNSRQPWQPGETIQEKSGPADAQGKAVQISVDYVLYIDGSSFGPDSCHESLKIQAIQLGIAIAKGHLKKMLSERGQQAVIDELSK